MARVSTLLSGIEEISRSRRKALVLGFLAVALLALSLLVARPAHADTFTVNSAADPGTGGCDATQCTLREAINAANAASGADTINFDIPDATGLKTISPTSPLPAITDEVTIDGYTQEGASANTRATGNDAVHKIQLVGVNAGEGADGLEITGSNSVIKGLVINRFDGSGIAVSGSGATGNRIEGNFIGTTAAGTGAPGNNGDGVNIFDAANNTVGGEASEARNLISGNGEDGIFVDTATGNKVLGNYIGTDRTGLADLGNDDGVLIFDAQATTIGGTTGGARNVISGNQSNGVLISGSGAVGNRVLGNFIGTTAAGNADLGNNFDGVNITDAPQNRVGGTASGAGNVISGNQSEGVLIAGSGATGNKVERNSIRNNATEGVILLSAAADNTIGGTTGVAGNVIFNNGTDGVAILSGTGNRILSNQIFGNSGLGINLDGGTENNFGVTGNDTDDPDTGPNDLQNFPVITSAIRFSTGFTTISGTLNSNPNQDFTVQCFVAAPDPSGHGEGQIPAGQDTTVTTDANGDAGFTCASTVPPSGQAVTATTTNTASGDTSEFSRIVGVVPGP